VPPDPLAGFKGALLRGGNGKGEEGGQGRAGEWGWGGEGREGREREKEREGIREGREGKENWDRPPTIFGLKVALEHIIPGVYCEQNGYTLMRNKKWETTV